jgi:hypothetical protein
MAILIHIINSRAVRAVFTCAILLPLAVLLALQVAYGQNYSSLLVNGLLSLGYPLDRQSVVALDKISMRFDNRNRIDVLEKILQDRHTIHSMVTGDHFAKTEVICNALRLLDELDLPITRQIIAKLVNEQGWQKKERRLLAYMAARRNIDFESNISYLINAMPCKGSDLEEEWGRDISLSIMDICNTLSFLTELFIYRGNTEIMDALVKYAEQAYGYPKEYLSYMFLEMFLKRPVLFVDILSTKDVHRASLVVNSLFFARWTNNVKEKVEQILQEDLVENGYLHNWVVIMLHKRLKRYSKKNHANHETAPH